MTENPLAHRLDYTLDELDDAALSASPLDLFQRWLTDAADLPEPNAMVVSTVDAEARLTSRTVLLRGVDDDGALWFFTNRDSRKGQALAAESGGVDPVPLVRAAAPGDRARHGHAPARRTR